MKLPLLYKPLWALSLLLLLLLLSAQLAAPVQGANGNTNAGRKFVTVFLQNLSTTSLELFVASASPNPASVTVSSSASNQAFVVAPNGLETRSLPVSLIASSGLFGNKVITIESDEDIVVYGLNQRDFTTDAFLLLPVATLGTHYISGSYLLGASQRPARFAIVATVDGTSVNVVGTAQCPQNIVGQMLNEGQTLVLDCADSTGVDITSSAPVALISSNECAQVPLGAQFCDHIVSQLPPVSTWGVRFLSVPFATRTRDTFRVVASQANTAVQKNGAALTTLANAGDFFEFNENTMFELTCDEPCMFLQFMRSAQADGSPEQAGDPAFTFIAPVPQFTSGYTLSTPATNFANNFVNLVVPSGQEGGIRLDGNPLVMPTWQAIGASGFVGTQLSVTVGPHSITHVSPIVQFGAVSYGLDNRDSYAYLGGLRLAAINEQCTPSATVPGDGLDNDCDGAIDEELADGLDNDGDGQVDEDLAFEQPPADQCPNDPNKLEPGDCGCGIPDTDLNGNNIADCLECFNRIECDPSFESQEQCQFAVNGDQFCLFLAPFQLQSGGETCWTLTSGEIDVKRTYWQASHGAQSVDMNGRVAGTLVSKAYTLAAGAYAVTFDLSGNPFRDYQKRVRIEVLDASDDSLINAMEYSFSGPNSAAAMNYIARMQLFTLGAQAGVRVRITSLNNNEDPQMYGPVVDNLAIKPTHCI